MDQDRERARHLLGVGPDATIDELRSAYRALMRRHHPDVARSDPAATDIAARLTTAYALLSTPDPLFPAGPPTRSTPPPPEGPTTAQVRADGAIVVEAPGPDTFLRVHEALDSLGHVTYQDRSGGYLQAMVQPDQGPLCTMVATIEPRAIDSVVLISLDSMDSNDAPSVDPLLVELARLIGDG